jgi:hypothetical protein
MKIIKKCDICGNNNFEQVHTIYDKALDLREEFKLFKCTKCNLIFINPQPSFKELNKHYQNE